MKQLELTNRLFGMQNVTATFENDLAVSCEVKHALTIQPRKPTEMKTMYKQKPVCECLSRRYSKSSKPRSLQCLSAGKGINKWYIHTMYYNSAIKKKKNNKVLIQATTQMNLKCILQSEKSQTSKNYVLRDYRMILFI